MCGIVGYLSRSGRRTIGQARLTSMRDTMIHRGPDSYGTALFDTGRVGLAHRRLAIIDLSSAGHEPMSFQNQRYWLTFNGEIYNATELRSNLEANGCTFRSSCDAEILLAAYATWGRDCVQRFIGMWAFAIWDEFEKTLFCSRDRFGIKPFYYYDDGDLFIFASEIRAILSSGSVPLKPHREALFAYLQAELVDGLEATCFQGINRLQPSYCMLISERRNEVWRYWDLDVAPFSQNDSRQDDIERVRDTFEEAVRSHLVSDVSFGVSLSGGLDSSSIFAVASRLSTTPVRTYTAYYEEAGPFDERHYSDSMTAMYPALEYQVRPEQVQLFETLSRIIWHLEEPPLAHGVYPRWHIAKCASRHVKVLLVGQGGDELLAGYSYYFNDLIKDYISRGLLLNACREIAWTWKRQGKHGSITLLKALLKRKFLSRFRQKTKRAPISVLGPLLKDLDPSLPQRKKSTFDQSWLNEHLYYDTVHGLLPTLLKYEDKIDMAFSIEGRVPFLDHRFAELCFSLGLKAKIHDGWSKLILREAMDGLLPTGVQWRCDKIGFPTPYRAWFSGPLFGEAEARIMDSALCGDGYLDRAQIEKLLRAHREGTRQLSTTIWKWLCLSMWFEGNTNLSDPSYSARLSEAS